MNLKKTMYALAVGIMGAMSTVNAFATALPNLPTGSTLSINPGIVVLSADDSQIDITGSWFAFDNNSNGTVSGNEKMPLQQGTTGIVIGVATTAGASHPGEPTASDTNAITAPWSFLGNTGSDYTTVGITAIGGNTANGLDMSGWTLGWNGVTPNNMGSGAWGAGFSNGVGNITWDGISGHAYTLDYTATTQSGPFTGIRYALHLEGVVAVPEASTYFMMLAGLGLVGAATARRRKQSKV
jgi:hypothetical protein